MERKQDEFSAVISALKNYASRDNKYVEAKNKLLNNAKNVYKGREKIIEGFKNELFPFYYDEEYEHQMKVEREIEEEQKKQYANKFNEWINKEKTDINNELFKKTF